MWENVKEWISKGSKPDPLVWSEDGPVFNEGVRPEYSVQSNTSCLDWLHPEHNPLSKSQDTRSESGK